MYMYYEIYDRCACTFINVQDHIIFIINHVSVPNSLFIPFLSLSVTPPVSSPQSVSFVTLPLLVGQFSIVIIITPY